MVSYCCRDFLGYPDCTLGLAGSLYAIRHVGRGKPLHACNRGSVVPIVAVWVGLRSLMGLYPGYALSPAERLRRHTYSVVGTLAILAVFATILQFAVLLSRSLLALGLAGLLFLAPLAQHSVRWGMRRLGLWGRPAIIIGYKNTSARTVKLLEKEWG
jgi:hypothetical protein